MSLQQHDDVVVDVVRIFYAALTDAVKIERLVGGRVISIKNTWGPDICGDGLTMSLCHGPAYNTAVHHAFMLDLMMIPTHSGDELIKLHVVANFKFALDNNIYDLYTDVEETVEYETLV